jgi:hypothetical protein
MIRSTLGTFIALFVIAITTMRVSAELEPDVELREARLQFEVALQALETDHRRLAESLLRQLADTAVDSPERAVYDALIARTDGRAADFEAIVQEAFADSSPEQYSCPWVYDELVRLAAELRLTRLTHEADERLEQVLARHHEARGGLDRLASMQDLVVTGRMVIGDGELPFRLLRKRPSLYRLDLATPQGVRIVACDGQAAWRADPAQGEGEVQYLSGSQRDRMLQQSHFDDVLIRYRQTGERLFLVGTETISGREAYRIDVDNQRGDRHAVFLDTATFLEVQRLIWTDPDGPPVELTYEYLDVEGMPMQARQTVTSTTGIVEYFFDDYHLDQVIDLEVFDAGSIARAED